MVRRSRRGSGRFRMRCSHGSAGGTVSRITAQLKAGAGVVTTRGHVHWVVTEYGARNLHGLTVRERGEALISIAHPDTRGELHRARIDLRHYTMA